MRKAKGPPGPSDKYEMARDILKVRDYKVVKANDLIQQSRFHLTLQEQKIILYLISKIKPNDYDFAVHEFSIIDFCRICGIDYDNGKNYKNIKDAIKNLADKSIWITLEDGSETILRWIDRAWINKKSGLVKIKIDDMMKPYLLRLKARFTQYELFYTLAMRSRYSLRLYELLKSYEYQQKKTFDINELKRTLSTENYVRYPDFKRYVIDIAMKEINELTDISIEYEVIQEGKRYTKIKFSIEVKKNMQERLKAWNKIYEIIDSEHKSLFDNQ